MKLVLYTFFVIFILLSGCSRDNPVSPDTPAAKGAIVLKIDRENAPSSVALVTATLSRPNYPPIISEMNLLTDSTAELSLPEIPVGQWHLKIDAKNQSGVIEYTGETDVTIIQNVTIQVTLTLYPVQGETGGIYIFVTWGTAQAVWQDSPANPVLTPGQNPINPNYVKQSRVIFDNNIYKMWYSAVLPSGVHDVWYAESADGKAWNTIGTQPVLPRGSSGSWDDYAVIALSVLKDGNTYKMYYLGFDEHPYNTSWKIGIAFSNDGRNWEKHGQPVLNEAGQYYRISMTSVVKHNNVYYGYFSYLNSNFSESSIGAAVSRDGINWSFHNANPILSQSYPWEGDGINFPSVIYDEGKFKMIYEDGNQNAFGYAESGNNPFRLIKAQRPIFRAAQSLNNWTDISRPNFVKINNQYRVYYTAYLGSSNGICFIYK